MSEINDRPHHPLSTCPTFRPSVCLCDSPKIVQSAPLSTTCWPTLWAHLLTVGLTKLREGSKKRRVCNWNSTWQPSKRNEMHNFSCNCNCSTIATVLWPSRHANSLGHEISQLFLISYLAHLKF